MQTSNTTANATTEEESPQAAFLELLESVRAHAEFQRDSGLRWSAPLPRREKPPLPVQEKPAPAVVEVKSGPRDLVAEGAPANLGTLDDLRAHIGDCRRCKLAPGRTNLVFGVGNPKAELMFVGEGPGRDEDLQGLPFVGRSGQLLDRMLNSIGLDRQSSAYITNVIFWRPPGNRPPTAEEAATCAPFLLRHIELKQPKVLVLLGGAPVKHVLNLEEGITRLRGRWGRAVLGGVEIPALPTFHPAYLLRTPGAKRQAWQDMLSLKLRLREMGAP